MRVFSSRSASSSVRVEMVSKRFLLGPPGAGVEIGSHPLPERQGLPDVEDLSPVAAEEIDARGIRQILRSAARLDHGDECNPSRRARGA
jgi:hypothetical protein